MVCRELAQAAKRRRLEVVSAELERMDMDALLAKAFSYQDDIQSTDRHSLIAIITKGHAEKATVLIDGKRRSVRMIKKETGRVEVDSGSESGSDTDSGTEISSEEQEQEQEEEEVCVQPKPKPLSFSRVVDEEHDQTTCSNTETEQEEVGVHHVLGHVRVHANGNGQVNNLKPDKHDDDDDDLLDVD